VFCVKLFDPQPEGAQLSKKTTCVIEILSEEDEELKKQRQMQSLLTYYFEN